ncbi:hypothetical protein J6O86_01470 [bacterium]|nr:hypothetical protein [bacterium]
MSYRYDSELVIANRLSSASGDAKAVLWETYDRLRDLTVSGSGTGSGFESCGNLIYNMASLLAPSSFATVFGGSETMNVPGTSYYSKGNTGTAYGVDSLYNYSGFPGGAASVSSVYGLATGGASSILNGWGSNGFSTSGTATGYASNVAGVADIASAAAYGIGTSSGLGKISSNVVMPVASTISGFGGLLTAISPYLGVYGAGTTVLGNLMQGTTSAALAAYQNITGNITTNADVILSTKVRNIETVCKMLDTQGDIVKKMLKESMESSKNALQNL